MREFVISVPLRNRPSWHNNNTTPLKRYVRLWAPKDEATTLNEEVGITDPQGERRVGKVVELTWERKRPDEVKMRVRILEAS